MTQADCVAFEWDPSIARRLWQEFSGMAGAQLLSANGANKNASVRMPSIWLKFKH